MVTLLAILLGAAATVAVGVAAGEIAEAVNEGTVRDYIKQWCKDNNYNLSDDQIQQLVDEYSYQFDVTDWNTWFKGTDWDELDKWLEDQLSAVEDLGYDSERPTEENLEEIEQEAEQEILDEEHALEQMYEDTYLDSVNRLDQANAEINALYDQALQRETSAFQKELDYNNQTYGDMVNQILTNDAMSQQAIAGATRYEMDRERRNAISRGASAAMRLVGNINTQLGLQNQAAQQSLDTSNQLAQMMLNQRQAGSSLRQNYINALNTNAYSKAGQLNNYTGQRIGLSSDRANALAGLRNGLTERAWGYGRNKRDAAYSDWHNSHQDWLDSVYEYYSGDDEAAQSYIKNHGSRRK